MRKILLLVTIFLFGATGAKAIDDPITPDTIRVQEVEISAGQNGVMTLSIFADDTTHFNDITWQGIGSFCIPLRYEKAVMKVDSVKFEGTVAKWDEKFSNTKMDTGFISLAGIYNLGGADNPPLYLPGEYQNIASIYFTVLPKAKKGIYGVILTHDPIQREMYCGSTDGFNSWKPVFVPGKIRIK